MIGIKRKKIFLLFGILFLGCFIRDIYAQDSLKKDTTKNNSMAVDVFKTHLAFADTVSSLELLAEAKSVEGDRIEKAIKFLEQVTQIPSTAEYTYAGRFKIPREDYKKWKKWFCENKQYLRWDSKDEKVIVLERNQREKN